MARTSPGRAGRIRGVVEGSVCGGTVICTTYSNTHSTVYISMPVRAAPRSMTAPPGISPLDQQPRRGDLVDDQVRDDPGAQRGAQRSDLVVPGHRAHPAGDGAQLVRHGPG